MRHKVTKWYYDPPGYFVCLSASLWLSFTDKKQIQISNGPSSTALTMAVLVSRLASQIKF